MRQSYKQIEIILVDDGSPDKCPEICDEYAKKDKRIVVIHQKNKGVSAARNAGLEKATGYYIGFVDPDDYIEEDMYEILLRAIMNENAELGVCGNKIIDERNYGIIGTNALINKCVTAKECINDLFSLDGLSVKPQVWNKVFIRNVIGELRFDEELRISEDLKFVVEYISAIDKCVYIENTFYHNVKRVGSATRGAGKAADICATVDVDNEIYRIVKRKFYESIDIVLAWIIQDNMGWYDYMNKHVSAEDKIGYMIRMKKKMRKNRIRGLFNKLTYWKTRIVYFLGIF